MSADLPHRLDRIVARHVAEQAGLAVNDSWIDGETERWLSVAQEMLAEVAREKGSAGRPQERAQLARTGDKGP